MDLCASFGLITTLNCNFGEGVEEVANPMCSVSRRLIRAVGISIPGDTDRQKQIAGFNQEKFSQSHVLCIGAGGLISSIGPGVGTQQSAGILDADFVEASNLNRQLFTLPTSDKTKRLL
jgi:hypothetical protein